MGARVVLLYGTGQLTAMVTVSAMPVLVASPPK
jgi:hypothetical protein